MFGRKKPDNCFVFSCIFYLIIFKRKKKKQNIRRLNKNVTQLHTGLFILKHFHITDAKRSSNNPLRVGRFPYLTHEENQGLDTLSNWLPVICVLMIELGQKSRFLTDKKMHFPLGRQQTWIILNFLGAVLIHCPSGPHKQHSNNSNISASQMIVPMAMILNIT